jgi:DNA-binding IclR family transcriptional regulator
MKEDRSNYIIQKVCSALDVLDQLKMDARGELGVTELSRRLDLQKNMVFRLLASLESRNFVEQNLATGGYRLGLKNLEMCQGISHQLKLNTHARPILEELTLALQETSCVSVFKKGYVFCVDSVETPLPVRVVTQLGRWFPSYCTAAGKVFLAELGDAERELQLPAELQPFTARTLVDRKDLRKELAHVSRQGYALDDEELETGVRCVSVPIRGCDGRVVGALSVLGPSSRFSYERLDNEIVPLVRKGGEKLSMRLWYP